MKIETWLQTNNRASLIQSESYRPNAKSMRARRFLNKETVPAETTFSGKLFHKLTIRLVKYYLVEVILNENLLYVFVYFIMSMKVG